MTNLMPYAAGEPSIGGGLGDHVYNRLLGERIIFLGQQVDDDIANKITAQMLLLAADPDKDIYLYINSPGGSVTAGMAIYDTMQYIPNDVVTIGMGMAASMGQFLLTGGTAGKRFALPNTDILMHQGSAASAAPPPTSRSRPSTCSARRSGWPRSPRATPASPWRRSSATATATAGSPRRRPRTTASSTRSSPPPRASRAVAAPAPEPADTERHAPPHQQNAPRRSHQDGEHPASNFSASGLYTGPQVDNRYVVPRFVERTSQGVREYDPYAKLFEERVIFLGVQIDDASANDVMAQLLCLESMDPDRDISIYINSPGGSMTALTAIYDTMQFVKPDIQTVCMGQAASAAAVLLAAGTPGKRMALPNARVLIHQPSGGTGREQLSDLEIAANEILRMRTQIEEMLAKHSNQPIEKIRDDIERDKILTAEDALAYGLVDQIVTTRKSTAAAAA